jgi:hypothetical protein
MSESGIVDIGGLREGVEYNFVSDTVTGDVTMVNFMLLFIESALGLSLIIKSTTDKTVFCVKSKSCIVFLHYPE